MKRTSSEARPRGAITPERPRKDVLVVDAVEFYGRMLTELLTGQGYRVQAVADPETACQLLQSEGFDLLVLDATLPPTGGHGLLGRLQEAGLKPPPTVLLTPAFQSDGDWPDLVRLGVNEVVARSAPVDDLLAAARTALFPDAKNLRKSLRAQVHIPMAYRFDDQPEPGHFTHTYNLSADGMFVVSAAVEPPSPGTRLHVRFWIPSATEVISAEGIVIWCNRAGSRMNELYPPGMGVMFLGIDPHLAREIDDYVRQRGQPAAPTRQENRP